MSIRFFLGVAEATVAPAFALLTGSFYKRGEQPLRQCLWFVGNALAGVFGSLVAHRISYINGALEPWKVSSSCSRKVYLRY
jgi:ACS family allantoate permease-like MFS transporter